MNACEVLGVSSTASRTFSACHPDKADWSDFNLQHTDFKRITDAYEAVHTPDLGTQMSVGEMERQRCLRDFANPTKHKAPCGASTRVVCSLSGPSAQARVSLAMVLVRCAAFWVGHGLEPRPQFHEKTSPEREERMKFPAGERKKSAKFLAPHPSGPQPFVPHFFWVRAPTPPGPHPSGPPPLRALTPPGPHPSGPPPLPQPLRAPTPPGAHPFEHPQRTPHPTPKKNWPNAVWPNSAK